MLYRLLLLFILLPLVETTLLLLMGYMTEGVLVPLLFIILTGVLGSWLARQQGFAVYRRIQAELAGGRMPTDAMIDGVLIFVAGVLLVSPGVLTDLFGITMLIPPLRVFYRQQLIAWFHRTFKINVTLPGGESVARSQVIDSYVVEKQSPDDVGDQI